jgi:arginyl-tRNA synthetase
LIVRVYLPDDKEPMPPMIIQKSNGGDIYGTTDLGTLVQRKQDWNPDEVWYVVDNRQAFHFKQVFRAATLAGILGDTKCIHINFGTMNGKYGKPYKTRDGGVMSLSDLIDDVVGSAGNKVRESAVITGEAEQKEAATTIGMAALRVGDMLNHRIKDFVFDMERFLASEGKTGPYLQYTAVRIASILQKAKDANMVVGPIIVPASDTERGLMLALTTVSEALLRAFEDKTPSVICEILFDIAGIFNRFYFENKILVCEDEAQRASWLGLCELTQRMLITLLDLLGINVPEKM